MRRVDEVGTPAVRVYAEGQAVQLQEARCSGVGVGTIHELDLS